jgi:hypothetical protein
MAEEPQAVDRLVGKLDDYEVQLPEEEASPEERDDTPLR